MLAQTSTVSRCKPGAGPITTVAPGEPVLTTYQRTVQGVWSGVRKLVTQGWAVAYQAVGPKGSFT